MQEGQGGGATSLAHKPFIFTERTYFFHHHPLLFAKHDKNSVIICFLVAAMQLLKNRSCWHGALIPARQILWEVLCKFQLTPRCQIGVECMGTKTEFKRHEFEFLQITIVRSELGQLFITMRD